MPGWWGSVCAGGDGRETRGSRVSKLAATPLNGRCGSSAGGRGCLRRVRSPGRCGVRWLDRAEKCGQRDRRSSCKWNGGGIGSWRGYVSVVAMILRHRRGQETRSGGRPSVEYLIGALERWWGSQASRLLLRTAANRVAAPVYASCWRCWVKGGAGRRWLVETEYKKLRELRCSRRRRGSGWEVDGAEDGVHSAWGRYQFVQGVLRRRYGVLEAPDGSGREARRPTARRISHGRPVPVAGCSSNHPTTHSPCVGRSIREDPRPGVVG